MYCFIASFYFRIYVIFVLQMIILNIMEVVDKAYNCLNNHLF